MLKTYQQPDDKETKISWRIIWEQMEYNRQTKRISQIGKRVKGAERGIEGEIHLDSLRAAPKNVPNGKTPVRDSIYWYWFKKFSPIHARLAIERMRCLQDTDIPK